MMKSEKFFNYELFKLVVKKHVCDRNAALFFNHTRKFLQELYHEDTVSARNHLELAIKNLCRMNSQCMNAYGERFLNRVVNYMDEVDMRFVIGIILKDISSDLLKQDAA